MSQITLEPLSTIQAQFFVTHQFDSSQFPLPLHKHISLNDFQMYMVEVNGILALERHACTSPSKFEQHSMNLWRQSKSTSILLFLEIFLMLFAIGTFTGCFFVPFLSLQVFMGMFGVLVFFGTFVGLFSKIFMLHVAKRGLRKCNDERLEKLRALVRERNQYFEPKGVQFNVQGMDFSYRSDDEVHVTTTPVLVVYLSDDAPPYSHQQQHSTQQLPPQCPSQYSQQNTVQNTAFVGSGYTLAPNQQNGFAQNSIPQYYYGSYQQ
eukprot:CAMPEP_0117446652 /NCGR_PEP_ID=MMETSP0759-20121206/6460_1 /TAXON_ID=63605 /ORGANISM="Percolomonas cosmopolitus, Strain WS" /LENGTH=263 /DNA_ID=CAMNT_0005238943 /DNA_START=34 /DNA_END=825 /DNA_ORIENTATION=-